MYPALYNVNVRLILFSFSLKRHVVLIVVANIPQTSFFLSVPIRIFDTFYITENILFFSGHASFKVDDSIVLPELPVCNQKSIT